jgi:hypothetical protein
VALLVTFAALVTFTTLVALAGLLGLLGFLEGCCCNAGRRLWGLAAASEAPSVRSASLVWSASWGISSAGIVGLASLEDALDLVTKSLELLDAVAHFDQKWGEIAAATNQIASLAICRVLIGLVAFTVVSLGLIVVLGIVISLGLIATLGFVATLRAIAALGFVSIVGAIAALGLVSTLGTIATIGLVSIAGSVAIVGLVSIAGSVAIVGVIAITSFLGLVARIVLMSRLVGGSVLVGLFHATVTLLTVGSITTF